MSEVAKRLRDRRLNIWEQAKGLLDRATSENRDFSAEEESQWDALNGEMGAIDKRLQDVLEGEQRARDADAALAELAAKGAGPAKSGKDGEKRDLNAELRALLRRDEGAPRAIEIKPDKPIDIRAMTAAVASGGGDTVPTSFYNRLVEHMIEVSAILQANPTVLNTNSGEALQIPKTSAYSTSPTSTLAEGDQISESDPTFDQVTLDAFKYGNLMKISPELVSDTGVDLLGFLARQAGRALGNALGRDLVVGNGTSKPKGIVTGATLGVTGATGAGGVMTADDLIDLFYSVIAPYRASRSCYWMAADATWGKVRKLKDDNGQYLWQPSLILGQPDLLLNKPVVSDPNMAAVAAGAKSVIFGDFSAYFVRMVGGLRFERSDDFDFDHDLITYRALLRADGDLVDTSGAVKYFLGGAAS